MSILFKDFLEKHHVSGEAMLVELKKCPPVADYVNKSPLFSEKYQNLLRDKHQKELIQTMLWLINENTHSLEAYSFDLASKLKFWGNLNFLPHHLHISLQALKFQLAQMGDNLSRASFAAFKLYEMLSPLAAKIYLKTNSQLAHPAVYIKLDRQWWIYDPNINPDLIFNNQDYRHEVVNHLPKIKHQEPKLNIQINPELWLLFQKQLPKLNDLIKNKLIEKHDENLEPLVDESINMLQKRMF